jgi:hypothetical protein
MTSAEELTLDGKYREICDDLKLAGINWRDVCVGALTAAHEDNAFAIERTKNAQKGGIDRTCGLVGFIKAVTRGTARITIRNSHVVPLLKSVDRIHAFEQLETVRRAQLSPHEFTDALQEYDVQFSVFKDVACLRHHDAGPWDGSVGPIITVYCLETECQLGAKRLDIEMGSPLMHALLGGAWPAGNDSLTEEAVIASARKLYAFAVSGGKCVGVLRSLLGKENTDLGIVQAAYPKETVAAMEAGAAFIITEDATWGSMLDNGEGINGSPTAEFLAKFREVYDIEPAKNAGGVICIRRA